MTLRLFAIVLLLANLVFGVWTLGWLDSVFGVQARTHREPDRVLQQVEPQSITVVPAGGTPSPVGRPGATTRNVPAALPVTPRASAPAATAPARDTAADGATAGGATPVPPLPAVPALATAAASQPLVDAASCLEASGLSTAQADVVEQQLAAWPASAWRRVSIDKPATFGAVMGPFPTRETLRGKASELERLKVPFERVPQPNADGSPAAAAPTLLVLSTRPTRDAAAGTLPGLTQRGVRTARVVPLSMPTSVHRVIVQGTDASQVQSLKAAGTGVPGKSFETCAV